MESSQATAKHMKQLARDPQAVQVNLLRHQHTKTPPSKSKRKIKPPSLDKKPANFMKRNQEGHKKIEDLILNIQGKTDVQNVVTPSTEKVLGVQQASTNARFVINLNLNLSGLSEDYSSEEDSFCLQLQMQSTQGETNSHKFGIQVKTL